MNKIVLSDYLSSVKAERVNFFVQPYDLAYESFCLLGYDKEAPEFFMQNASLVVDNLRRECWKKFVKREKEFTSNMLKKLIDEDTVKDMKPEEAISWFAETYPEHIYQLNLSNTQSRRSRAGKEFESIIELILIGAKVPMDSQGNIGKASFVQKGLGKLVDAVSPGVIEFVINKRKTVLISAKTTLRERWQEVPEEMGRTGASEMFLATLDETISKEVLDTLYEANIQVTTTKTIKDKFYIDNDRVLTFEDLVAICLDNKGKWDTYNYSVEQIENMIISLTRQREKHDTHPFVKDAFTERIEKYSRLLSNH